MRRRTKLVARSRAWLFLQRFLLITGLLGVGFAASSYVARYVYQRYETWQFDQELAHRLATPAPQSPNQAAQPAIGPSPKGPVIGRIAIPRLGITAMVKEGVNLRTLGLAVGHISSTALPGAAGNIGLAAHRDTLFRNLKDVRVDDEILLTTLESQYLYRVLWFKVVEPTETSVLEPTADRETLTLVTCYPFYFVGHAPQRFVVRAQKVESQPRLVAPVT